MIFSRLFSNDFIDFLFYSCRFPLSSEILYSGHILVSYLPENSHYIETFCICPDILFSSLRSLKPILRKQSWLWMQVWQQGLQICQNTTNKVARQCWFWADLVSNLYHNTPRMLKTFSIFVVSSQDDATYWWKCFAFSLNGNLENSLVQGYSKQHSPLVLSYIVLDI